MSTEAPKTSSRRARVVSILLVVALVATAIVLRRPLAAWFTGAGAGGDVEPATAASIDHYTCSMHPTVNQRAPGKCPVCGMDLVPVTREHQAEGVVTIDAARRQLIGVRTGRVVEAPMRVTFQAVGKLTYDESRLADVDLEVRGWITHLAVSQTGQRVARGQTLFTMYSPELFNAQQDFLLATRSAPRATAPPADGGGAEAPRAPSFGGAARKRLRLLGMSDAQIDEVARRGAPMESTAVASPASGFVIEKNVVQGGSVDPGTRLYRIAALDEVWVEAEVYEAELGRVRVGQSAVVTLDYLPGKRFDAKVAYVYPYLDPQTRTGRVRVKLANEDLELRPGMYARVELAADLGDRVQVPSAALVYTGPRRLVFVDLGQGRFEPREVRIGAEANGMAEVLAGLRPGDVVATSGVVLIAAEARIRTAAKYWESAPDAPDGPDASDALDAGGAP
jgi:Cu(I)/Ag(I) efflux system membrane fusion protein